MSRRHVDSGPSLFAELDEAKAVPAHARHSGPVGAPYSNQTTSKIAARSIVGILNELQDRVLSCIRGAGERGMTCEEVEFALSMRHSTASPRIKELREEPFWLIRESGRKRPTTSGRPAIVWLAVPESEVPA